MFPIMKFYGKIPFKYRGGISPAPVILQIERRRQFPGGLLHLPQVSPDIEIEGRACVDVAQNLLDALNVRPALF